MRSHGITDFPDPDSGGGIAISAGPGSDLAPNNPLFQSAQRACQALMPKPSAAQQRQFMEQALKFAQCMRSHGITDFPDPQGNGGIVIQKGSGGGTSSSALDPNNPQFRAAQEACKGYLPGGGKGMGLSTHSGP
jgi:hypothetical protein